ncbi:MAG: transcriptional regulator [Sphingomonadales bacterium]|nr:transcriptional regulator [Sphingomonadales bacterium]
MTCLPPRAFETFAAAYPERPTVFDHELCHHPLMTLEALAALAERLPPSCIEHAAAEQPIGIDGKPPVPAISPADAIRTIDTCGIWVALTFIEQDPAYHALLMQVIDELRPAIEPRTGRIHKPAAFVFVTSPGGTTPYHFDPEHNILLQIRGSKVMTQFPAADSACSPGEAHEAYHTGGPRELHWRDELAAAGTDFALFPGQGLIVPVMAPHYVRTGPQASISLSITWRSEWSYAEADAHAFNAVLRRAGLRPSRPGRWPAQNRAKAFGWRALKKLGVR